MGMAWNLARWPLYSLDAEKAHQWTVSTLRRLPRFALRALCETPIPGVATRPVELLGLRFRSALGLAAGFDKNAELLELLPDLGFGFAEIGTVTPLPQEGNPRPRLFRFPEERALFNRMGFNNEGATKVAQRLARARSSLPSDFPIGVNLGKNKVTPAEKAAADYVSAAEAFEGLADYLVINVSSPNTPGLRALQEVETLRGLVGAVLERIASWRKTPPLLVKLAPELGDPESLGPVLEMGRQLGVSGWVLTNTLAGEHAGGPGGWSGAPVAAASLRSLRAARSLSPVPLISVGGILSPEDAVDRVREGASLIQVYSGWVFGGPRFPGRVARALGSH
jgi:dihydroorotate dehydrogenase